MRATSLPEVTTLGHKSWRKGRLKNGVCEVRCFWFYSLACLI